MKQRPWLALFGFGLLVFTAAADAVGQEKSREFHIQSGKVQAITVEDVWMGRLSDDDERDRVRGTFCHVCVVTLDAGKNYQIDMQGGRKVDAYPMLDAYLRLEDDKGRHLESNDDAPGAYGTTLNARISFPCKVTGKYRIIATTFDGGTGDYLLRVSAAAFLATPYLTRGDGSMARAADSITRGSAASIEKEYDNAIADYTKAIALDPSYVPAYMFRGRAQSHKNDYDKAIEDYRKVIQLDPKNVHEYNVMAYIGLGDASMARAASSALKHREYDQAIEAYTKVIGLDPGNVYERNVYAYLRRATARFNKNDNDKAIADYHEALRIQEALRKAIELGYRDFRRRENDSLLQSIRNDIRYKDLLKRQD